MAEGGVAVIQYAVFVRGAEDVLVEFWEDFCQVGAVEVPRGDEGNVRISCELLTLYSSPCACYVLFFLLENSVYDSIGKEGSNILHGNVDRLGSYSECTSAQASSGNFSGQYCKFTIQQGKIEYTVAICVPSSCKKDDILMLEWLGIFTYKNKSFIAPSQILSFISANDTYRVKSVHCQNNTPYIDVFVGICIFVVALFITMMIAGSIYVTIKEWKSKGKMMEDDLSPPHKNYKTISVSKINGHQLQESSAKSQHQSSDHGVTEGKNNKVGFLEWMLTSFAIQKTVPAVLSTQITAGSYSAIHGIRVLSLLWIISGHVCHFTLLNNLDNPVQWLLSVPNNVLYIFSLGGPFYLAVDTFFLLSGLLSARTLLNMHHQPDQGLTKTVKDYVINRLQRILPLYIYTMCLFIGMCSLIPWKSLGENLKSHLEKCRRSWWTNLLFINNFILIDQQCMGWTWYLANDFQFHITTPIFIFLLFRNKVLMFALAGFLLMASFIVTALISWFFKLPIGLHIDARLLSHGEYNIQYYTKPYCRYGPFLIGIMLGILLHQKKTSLLTKTSVLTGWLCSLMTMAAVIALGYTLDDTVESYSAPPVLYQALHRTAWAAAVGWIILVCEEGHAGFVNTLLSSKLWIPVANLSYACFLIHPAVIDMYYGLQETLLHYTDINMFYLFLGHTVLAHIIGLALCILIENPMQALRKYF
ncbi:O-acyltransferase like protein [Leucoraja erinacea]|uniref:O-acyltransferase like protein n=1 Tax=Leucoraja erinaceus TaxID=7782 RepID=UPI00245776F3|nr:O-acyltransferase like protein [Leucoraja erinacea]